MANGTAKITRTFGTPTDRDKWTFSAWVKLNMVQEQGLFWGWGDASNYTNIDFQSTGKFSLYNHESGSAAGQLTTNRLFRDFSAWYHIVVVWDSGNAAAGDRIIFYINGVRETDFSTENNPAQDKDSAINGPNLHELGAKYGSYDISGCLSHVQFVDGLALAPTEFGEFDSTSGIWKIKTGCYATPGNNGFCLKMEDRTNLDLDSSSNANTFATTGTLTPTYDNPSNNFCTWNALSPVDSNFTYGNTKYTAVVNGSAVGTIAPTTGKWYWELKAVAVGSNYPRIGITRMDNGGDEWYETYPCGDGDGTARSWGSNNGGTSTKKLINGANAVLSGTAPFYSTGDILMFAMDLDNAKVWFGKDDVWYGNTDTTVTKADIVSNTATPTFSDLGTAKQWTPIAFSNGSGDVWAINCGNGDFEGTTITSPSADDAGIGAFKYAPPTGFYALCTKNLKTYG